MFITFSRISKTGLRNFARNAWLSTAATAVMTVTLTLIAVSYIATTTLNTTVKSVVEKIDVAVYLNDKTNTDQVQALTARLKQIENVQDVSFVSKSDALAEYRREYADDPKLLNEINENNNPLPASLRIKVRDQNKLQPVTDLINQPDVKPLLTEKDPISYSGDRKAAIDRIVSTANFIKLSGIVASVIFVVISTLIIFNTIRMAIFTRREEIEIMKLVGATSWFIRGPFIFEAALYGVIAAIISLALVYTIVIGGAPSLDEYFDTVALVDFFKSNVVLVGLIELLIGVAIGVFSSLVALTRYLKL